MTTGEKISSDTDETIDRPNEETVEIPARLDVRVKKYASENGMSFTSVVVEALDRLLRETR